MGKIKTHMFSTIITFVICEMTFYEAQTICTSPATQCRCQQGVNGFIINCRDKQLTQIPIFNNTNIEYYELTFSSAYPDTSTCSICNRITSIPPRAFANLKVKRIDLSKNLLTDISNDSFAGVEPYLEELLLEGDRTKEPNYVALKNLTGLTTLYLEHFQQDTFNSNNIFGHLQNLESLTLKSFTRLSSIESLTFQNKVPKLKNLMLEDLPLSIYPAGAVLNIPSLQILRFINTLVTNLYSDSFKDLHYLKELDLSHNMINSIDSDTFTGITDTLVFLNLALNRLGYNTRETLIFLSSKNWTKLEQLSLAFSKLEALPDGTFRTMPNLTYLTLESCLLPSVSSGLLRGLQNLHTLAASDNTITSISVDAFIHTPQLTDLRLNQHPDFSKDFALNFPPAAVESIRTSLTGLNLEYNRVNATQIWEIIQLLINLEELKLSSTNLVTVPDFVFRYNTKLQVLDLSSNQITSLDQRSFYGLKDNLTALTLFNNSLTTIDECVFKNFSKLNHLFLAGNMWNCDCNLLWLYDWIQHKVLTKHDIGIIVECVCHSPPRLNKMYIQDVNRSDLSCTTVYVPRMCPDYYITTTTTTTTTTATPKPLPVFKITITEAQIFSIKVSWTINDKRDVTGYLLSLVDLQNINSKILKTLTNNNTLFIFEGLQPQRAYNICLRVELNNILDQNVISCVNDSTKPVPAFELFSKAITETSIEVEWTVSDTTELTGFRLNIYPLSNPTNKHYQNVARDGSSFLFRNLTSSESYEICLELIINGQVYDKQEKCKAIQAKETKTTAPPRMSTEAQTSNENIPVIVGSFVGMVLFIVTVAIILYILIRMKKPSIVDPNYINDIRSCILPVTTSSSLR